MKIIEETDNKLIAYENNLYYYLISAFLFAISLLLIYTFVKDSNNQSLIIGLLILLVSFYSLRIGGTFTISIDKSINRMVVKIRSLFTQREAEIEIAQISAILVKIIHIGRASNYRVYLLRKDGSNIKLNKNLQLFSLFGTKEYQLGKKLSHFLGVPLYSESHQKRTLIN